VREAATEPLVDPRATDVERPLFERFGRRTLETFLGFALSSAANSIYLLVVARALGPRGTGVVSVGILLASGLAFIVSIAPALANVYFGARDARDRAALLSNSLLFAAGPAVLTSALTLAVLEATGLRFGAEWFELAIVLASVPFVVGGRLVQTLIIASGRSRAFNVLNTSGPILALVFAGLAFVIAGTRVWTALSAYAAAQIAVLALSLGAAQIVPGHPSRRLLSSSLRYGGRGFVANMIQVMNYRLDLFFVSSIRGPAAAGVYSIAVLLAELLWKIAAAASTILFPRVAADERAPVAFTLRVARVVVLLTSVAAIILLPVTEWIVLPLLKAEFADALLPLALLLPGVVALALAQILSGDLSGRGRPEYASYASAAGLIITLTLTPVLIVSFGASGAAVASTLSYVVTTAFFAAVFVRRFGVSLADLFLARPDDFLRSRSPERPH